MKRHRNKRYESCIRLSLRERIKEAMPHVFYWASNLVIFVLGMSLVCVMVFFLYWSFCKINQLANQGRDKDETTHIKHPTF